MEGEGRKVVQDADDRPIPKKRCHSITIAGAVAVCAATGVVAAALPCYVSLWRQLAMLAGQCNVIEILSFALASASFGVLGICYHELGHGLMSLIIDRQCGVRIDILHTRYCPEPEANRSRRETCCLAISKAAGGPVAHLIIIAVLVWNASATESTGTMAAVVFQPLVWLLACSVGSRQRPSDVQLLIAFGKLLSKLKSETPQ